MTRKPKALASDIAATLELLTTAAQKRDDITAIGNLSEQISQNYRALAICVLKNRKDTDGFFHWLIQSALMRKYYLEGVQGKDGAKPQYLRTSLADPVLDALAARQFALAARIGALSSPVFLKGEEYEEDFFYGDFLRQAAGGEEEALAPNLLAWEKLLQGGKDIRFDLAKALFERQATPFCNSLEALLEETRAKAEKKRNPKEDFYEMEDSVYYPLTWLWVEGLALLALAEHRGMNVSVDLPVCPRSLLSLSYKPFRPLAYPMLSL